MPPPIKLPRLSVNWKEQPELFERYWDDAMSSIEKTLNEILAIPAIEAALIAVAAATAAAQAAADNANTAATAVTAASSLALSYPGNPTTPPLISIDSTGSATISDHTRFYGDGTSVPVVGDVLATGAVPGEQVRFFYDDPTRAGNFVTYYWTIDPAAYPAQAGDTHSVGAGIVPGAGSANGDPVQPPGYVPL